MSVELDAAKLRDQITDRLRALGISAREASRRAGFNVGYVGDFLNGRSQKLELERIPNLAQALEMPTADLLGESHFDHPGISPMPTPTPNGLLPLYAPRLNTSGPNAELPSQASSFVPCLPALVGTVGSYAVRVWNDVAAPRYCMGETIYLSPEAKIHSGDWVLAVLKGVGAFIARLGEWERDIVPLTDGEGVRHVVDPADIEAMHRIVASVA